jgi:hypothetical protein
MRFTAAPRSARRALRAAAVLGLAVAALPVASASAATSVACDGGGFSVTLASGAVLKNTGAKVAAGALTGNLKVRGRYVSFDVVPSNLGVLDYTLTGAANPADMTGGVRTPVFASKTPALPAPLTGDLDVTVDSKGGLQLRRGGAAKMKIQAKDCAQGGIFQMEPEATAPVTITHTLAAGMFSFVNPFTGKINFGNGTSFRGKDSPQVATRLSQTETQTVWSVQPGGRMGGVLGEDAVELSAGASSCVSDCQAQNRIRGSVPVTDPAFSG